MPIPAELDAWPARVQRQLAEFARERDWTRFHDPRSLLLALVGEVGELTELYQWQTGIEPDQAKVSDEVADVFIYALRFADVPVLLSEFGEPILVAGDLVGHRGRNIDSRPSSGCGHRDEKGPEPPLTAGEAGGDVQQPVAQRLWFGLGQRVVEQQGRRCRSHQSTPSSDGGDRVVFTAEAINTGLDRWLLALRLVVDNASAMSISAAPAE